MRKYEVSVRFFDDEHAKATSHGFQIKTGVVSGAAEFGLNTAETLLAAFGTCILTNINSITKKMRLHLEKPNLKIEGFRQEKPPKIVSIKFILFE